MKISDKSLVICKHCGEQIEPTGGLLYLWTHADPNQQKCTVARPANGVLPKVIHKAKGEGR